MTIKKQHKGIRNLNAKHTVSIKHKAVQNETCLRRQMLPCTLKNDSPSIPLSKEKSLLI